MEDTEDGESAESANEQKTGDPRGAARKRDEPEVTLEDEPEDLEPLEEEETERAQPLERAPPPEGWPGLEPITDAEPEPEIASDTEERPEAELEPLERPIPDADRSRKPARTPRTGDDVRSELRSYLDGVRGRLDKGGGTGAGDLLDYLGKLSDYLPEREKKRFRGSTERLAMESLKARLAGKKSLRQKVAESFHPTVPRRDTPMTRSRVVDTFSYLKDLAAWHPDKAVGAAMRDRIESIVARMGRLK
jgi:hypothetical protein